MLILRPVRGGDLVDLVSLAGQLDSVNLPSDRDFIARRIERSERSFAGRMEDPSDAIFMFALEDTRERATVGSSMILSKVGRPGAPYYWLEVSTEERRSAELGHRFVHTKLRLRWTEDGPTEIGGLILGLPINMNGTEGPRAQATRAFLRNLALLTELPVVLWDERLSTAAAQRSLDEVGARGTKRRKLVDQVAAAWLLQSYLDSKSEPGDGQRSTACKDRDASTPEPNGGTS